MPLLKRLVFGFLSVGIILFGGLLNQTVISANHGKMPVFEAGCPDLTIINARHACAGATTHLGFLADWIYLGNYIYSPGDFGIFVGQVVGVIFLLSIAFMLLKRLDLYLSS